VLFLISLMVVPLAIGVTFAGLNWLVGVVASGFQNFHF
jgi:hypothetical protein